MTEHKKRSSQKPHWYFTVIEECVVCFGGKTFKIRHYDKRPEDAGERIEYKQFVHPHHFF